MKGMFIHYKLNRYLFVGSGIYTGNIEGLNGLPVIFYHALQHDGLPLEAVRVRPEYECREMVEWPDKVRRPRFIPERDVPKQLLLEAKK